MKNTDGESSRDSGVLSNPLTFLRSGYFYWDDASLGGRGGNGYYWMSRSANTTSSSSSVFGDTYLNPQVNYNDRGVGFPVRCVQILHHSH